MVPDHSIRNTWEPDGNANSHTPPWSTQSEPWGQDPAICGLTSLPGHSDDRSSEPLLEVRSWSVTWSEHSTPVPLGDAHGSLRAPMAHGVEHIHSLALYREVCLPLLYIILRCSNTEKWILNTSICTKSAMPSLKISTDFLPPAQLKCMGSQSFDVSLWLI